jgi:hypothetical protein
MPRAPDVFAIVADFVQAALTRKVVSAEAWDYGWSQANYRRSSRATMSHSGKKSVRLDSAGVALFEHGASQLLSSQVIRERYDAKEFWSLMASMIGALPLEATVVQLSAVIQRRIEDLLSPPNSVVVCPVANLAPLESVLDFGPLVLGVLDDKLKELIASKAGRAVLAQPNRDLWWASDSSRRGDAKAKPTVLAYISKSQLDRAIEEAGEAFENLVSIALMLEQNLENLSLYSLRGDLSRPGLRGLVADRSSLMELSENSPQISREIGAQILVDGVDGPITTVHWYSENPFPLEKLLCNSERMSAAQHLLSGTTAIDRRLVVAARWHARAHWSIDLADSVLALGISFDSMLSEQNPSPGRVLSERFALIDSDPEERGRRYHQFQAKYYPARSAVAHGAQSESDRKSVV